MIRDKHRYWQRQIACRVAGPGAQCYVHPDLSSCQQVPPPDGVETFPNEAFIKCRGNTHCRDSLSMFMTLTSLNCASKLVIKLPNCYCTNRIYTCLGYYVIKVSNSIQCKSSIKHSGTNTAICPGQRRPTQCHAITQINTIFHYIQHSLFYHFGGRNWKIFINKRYGNTAYTFSRLISNVLFWKRFYFYKQ